MHSSAKNYVCTIERPGEFIVFSLVGCPGMMGVNKHGLFVGVNNINTRDARPGILWPVFVRQCLEESENFAGFSEVIRKTNFTGAHNYLFSDGKTIEHWEISPTKSTKASGIKKGEKGVIFHTNHCLAKEMIEIEEPLAQNSTSQNRYEILNEKVNDLENSVDLFNLLQDHTGYPKSICGHFQSGAQDPSTTCGGGVYGHTTKKFKLWRGCPKEDNNYVERELSL
jgi:isopenicillin-N N-acyltransferase-like protein